jgi:hypothetical protein
MVRPSLKGWQERRLREDATRLREVATRCLGGRVCAGERTPVPLATHKFWNRKAHIRMMRVG